MNPVEKILGKNKKLFSDIYGKNAWTPPDGSPQARISTEGKQKSRLTDNGNERPTSNIGGANQAMLLAQKHNLQTGIETSTQEGYVIDKNGQKVEAWTWYNANANNIRQRRKYGGI
jgi:hypothetical protein